MSKHDVCYCDCHTYPGCYRSNPCSVCGHYNDTGILRDGYHNGWLSNIGKTIVYKVKYAGAEQFWHDSIYGINQDGDYYNSCHGIIKKSKVLGIFESYNDAKKKFPEIYN